MLYASVRSPGPSRVSVTCGWTPVCPAMSVRTRERQCILPLDAIPHSAATFFLGDAAGLELPLGVAAAAGVARPRLRSATAAAAVTSLRLVVGGPVRGVRMEVLPLARSPTPQIARRCAIRVDSLSVPCVRGAIHVNGSSWRVPDTAIGSPKPPDLCAGQTPSIDR